MAHRRRLLARLHFHVNLRRGRQGIQQRLLALVFDRWLFQRVLGDLRGWLLARLWFWRVAVVPPGVHRWSVSRLIRLRDRFRAHFAEFRFQIRQAVDQQLHRLMDGAHRLGHATLGRLLMRAQIEKFALQKVATPGWMRDRLRRQV